MKLNTFYHGCRSVAEAISIANFPAVKPNVNGVGFYCSNDYNVATKYGAYVIEIITEQEADVTRPICQDPHLTVAEQIAECGMESVFATEKTAIDLFVDAHYVVLRDHAGDVVMELGL